jgi:hypothetical protein
MVCIYGSMIRQIAGLSRLKHLEASEQPDTCCMRGELAADLRHSNLTALYVDSCVRQRVHSAANGLDDDYVNHMYKLCFSPSGEFEETLNEPRLGHLVEIDVQTCESDHQITGTKDAVQESLGTKCAWRGVTTQCDEIDAAMRCHRAPMYPKQAMAYGTMGSARYRLPGPRRRTAASIPAVAL